MPEANQCPDCGAAIPPGQPKGLCATCALKGALDLSGEDSTSTVAVSLTPEAGERIGRYKLLEKIGEGGCGVVYMAEQEEPVRRRVALKVIKPGMDTREVIARFEAERQALALMEHPHIAKVFDGGATDAGRPYFVMELVRGLRITDYCDQKNPSTRQRLDLFMQVCQAVQHAHQKGIIHRDLKPSNILVTVNDGVPVPKVIDFGIAKATGQALTDKTLFTRFHQFLGTPAYISPEQAEMTSLDIDTRSDIYSLGVLLYELLTGKTPFDAKELLASGIDAMRRTIREQEPVRPSARLSTLAANEQTTVAQQRQTDAPKLVNLLRGDLDWIVMKCLEKDRARRYETSSGLAADIQRHLHNEPVLASSPGHLHRFQKMVSRNKLAFAAASAVTVALLVGAVVSTAMFFKEQAALGGEKAARSQVVQKNVELKREKAEVERKNAEVERQKVELEQQKSEVERKNAEFRAMLVEAARSDHLVAEDKLRFGQEREAFAHLARACEYDPSNTLAAIKGIAALSIWNPMLPTVILAGHGYQDCSPHFSPDGMRIVTAGDTNAYIWNAANADVLMTLIGHTGKLWSAQFSPDGKRIVTVSWDGTSRVWDVATGRTLAILIGHERLVTAAQFNLDGTRVVTAAWGELARVSDAATGKLLTTLPEHVRTAEFSPDGMRIVTAGDTNAYIWDAATGSVLTTLAGHSHLVRIAQFSPDGTRIVTASHDGTVRVWDATTGNLLATLNNAGDSTRFSPDGMRIVTGSHDGTVRIWDPATGNVVVSLIGHTGSLRSAQFSPDGMRIVTASYDNTARLWDANTGIMLSTFSERGTGMRSAQFSPDGTRIVVALDNGSARVYYVPGRKPTTFVHTGPVWNAQFSPDNERIVTASDDKTSRVWGVANGKLLATLSGQMGRAWSAQFSPDGKHIVTAGDTHAFLWDAATGKLLATLIGHKDGMVIAQFSPDGRRIVTASGIASSDNGSIFSFVPYGDEATYLWYTNTGQILVGPTGYGGLRRTRFSADGSIVTAATETPVRVWDAGTGKVLVTLTGHSPALTGVQFSPDGTRIVTSLSDTARVWNAATGELMVTLDTLSTGARSAQFSPEGKRIVIASWDNTARVWDAATGRKLATLSGHTGMVWSVQFSPDGTHILAASSDYTLRFWNAVNTSAPSDNTPRVWDSASGKLLFTLAGHRGTVWSVQFSPDGTRILTASLDNTVRVWDAATGKSLATLAGHDLLVTSAHFSPDGTRIVTGSADRTARVWDVLPEGAGPPPEWFPDFFRYLAQMRLDAAGKFETLKPVDSLALRERLRGVLRASAGADTYFLRTLRKYLHE